MKHNWEYKPWQEVLTIINGKNQKNVESPHGQYPIYGSGGIMSYANSYLCPEDSVILGRKGSINKPIFVKTKFWNVDTAFGIVPNKSCIEAKFLYYFCVDYDFMRHNRATTLPSLVKADLLKIVMPIPPLVVQRRIVEELDGINSVIEAKREQIKQLDLLAQSLFYTMFGNPVYNDFDWECTTLGTIASFKNGLNYAPDESGKPIKCLGVGCFKDNKYLSPSDFLVLSISDSISNEYLLKDNDIVFVRSNGNKALIGRSVLVRDVDEDCTFSGFCIRCRVNSDSVNHSYLLHLLRTKEVRAVLTSSGRGCNIANINQKTLNAFPIILPPLELQRKFAAKVEAIEARKGEIEKSLRELQTLLDSRMDYWFN
jgi:type I restriction enzyme S subunit